MITEILKGVLKLPIVRHILAGVAIVFLLWFFSIAPLQEENEKLQGYILGLAENQQQVIKDLAIDPKYNISNNINNPKIKKGGDIRMVPENNLKVNASTLLSDTIVKQDTIKEKQHTWFGRQFQKIGNLFRRNDEVSSGNKVE